MATNPPTTADEIRRRRDARGAADPLNRLRALTERSFRQGAEAVTHRD